MKHVKLFEQFINEEDKFTYADAADMVVDDIRKEEQGIMAALKAIGAKNLTDIFVKYETPSDDFDYRKFKSSKQIPIDSEVYVKAELGKYMGDTVLVFDDGEDQFAYVKESAIYEAVSKKTLFKKLWSKQGVDSDTALRPGATVNPIDVLKPKRTDTMTFLKIPVKAENSVLDFGVREFGPDRFWQNTVNIYGTNASVICIKNLSDDEFEMLKGVVPTAVVDVWIISNYFSINPRKAALANGQKLDSVDSVADVTVTI